LVGGVGEQTPDELLAAARRRQGETNAKDGAEDDETTLADPPVECLGCRAPLTVAEVDRGVCACGEPVPQGSEKAKVRVVQCKQCSNAVKAGAYCSKCGASLMRSTSVPTMYHNGRMVDLPESTRDLLMVADCKAEVDTPDGGYRRETRQEAVDRAVRQDPAAYRRHVQATLGGGGMAKRRPATEAFAVAIAGMVSKSGGQLTTVEACDALMATSESARQIYKKRAFWRSGGLARNGREVRGDVRDGRASAKARA
jgi:hypothetical protein